MLKYQLCLEKKLGRQKIKGTKYLWTKIVWTKYCMDKM